MSNVLIIGASRGLGLEFARQCVAAGDRVLATGCGWGALAAMASTEFGAALTGVTLSTERLAFAQ